MIFSFNKLVFRFVNNILGKPVTTSVPSISIKFHANAEKIEELRFSDDDTPNSDEKNHQLGNLNPISTSSKFCLV